MGKYDLEDILAEVERKKQTQSKIGSIMRETAPPAPPAPKPPAPPAAASPYAPPVRRSAAPVEDEYATRTDLPLNHAAYAPPVRQADPPADTRAVQEQLELRRRERVQQFMQKPLDLEEAPVMAPPPPRRPTEDDNPYAVPDTDGVIDDEVAQFFGGMQQSRISTRPTRPAPDGAPRKKKKKKKGAPAQSGDRPRPEPGKERAPKREKRTPFPEAAEEESEYRRPEDARDVRHELFTIKKSLSMRLVVTVVCFGLLLYLAFCNLYPLPLFNAICPEVDMRLYILVNLLVLLIAVAVSNSVLIKGIAALFRLRADNDTPAALCILAVLAHGTALAVQPEAMHTGRGDLYFAVAGLVLVCNAIGKRIMIARTERNFSVASSGGERQGQYILRGRFAGKLSQGQGFSSPAVAYSAKVEFPERFLGISYSDNFGEGFSRFLSPIFLLFAFGLGLVCTLAFGQPAIGGLTIGCAVLCIASPLTPTLLANGPLLRASKALSSQGGVITGSESVNVFEEMTCVALSATELYPPKSVELQGLKTLAEELFPEALSDAASLMVQTGGTLRGICMEVIDQKTELLHPVENIRYEDGLGICCTVEGRELLVGNRNLLERYGIAVPGEEVEEKLTADGQCLLYLARPEKAVALLILRYRPNGAVGQQLVRLAKKELSLLVYAGDPNITAARVASDYRYPEEFIRIIAADEWEEYRELTAPRERGRGYILCARTGAPRLRCLAAVLSLRRAMQTGMVLQMAGLILGYALTAFLAFTESISLLGFGTLLIYQMFWLVMMLVLQSMQKY